MPESLLSSPVTAAAWQPGDSRAGFIGGSDIVHLLNQGPWGCRRRLYYDKMAVPADYPFEGNAHTRRGTKLEALAVEEYAAEFGRTCRRSPAVALPDRPHLAVHIDRMIVRSPANPGTGPGVLEVKCPTGRTFSRIKAFGMPLDYELQAQWGMALTGWRWASIWIFCADEWRGLKEDVERDDELCSLMLAAADGLWATVEEDRLDMDVRPLRQIPERLAEPDNRCWKCPWRRTCQGYGDAPDALYESEEEPDVEPESDPALADLVARYLEARSDAKESKDWQEQLKAELEARLGERLAVDTGNALVTQSRFAVKQYVVKARVQTRLSVKPKRSKEPNDGKPEDFVQPGNAQKTRQRPLSRAIQPSA